MNDQFGGRGFPRNEVRRKAWVESMHRKDFKVTHFSILCSAHFHKSCFTNCGARRNLKPDSSPTIFPGLTRRLRSRGSGKDLSRKRPKGRVLTRNLAQRVEAIPKPEEPIKGPGDDHAYSLPDPKELKRRLDLQIEANIVMSKRLKANHSVKKSLQRRLANLTDVIVDL
eukprot:maker-scaffold189_size271641-snap-gene-0.16 protein:Tk03796 transcript:maker-scaffold189_size271641-snap-gene-0.16-mRNA-1 annotation:"thap domain-containing protein 2"